MKLIQHTPDMLTTVTATNSTAYLVAVGELDTCSPLLKRNFPNKRKKPTQGRGRGEGITAA